MPTGGLYLVDAHSLIFQVFHAIRDMTSPAGLPTNALYGFVRDILFLRSLGPDYLVVAFDRPEPTFRSAIYPEYKAHREPPPDDLLRQIPMIERALHAMHVPVLYKVGFEADDILATLAVAGEQRGLEVFICTSDKDCRQLLSDRVRLYSLRKREAFGPADLMDDWGVRPDQVVDLQTLVGDGVDNVPGVPGIGVKTAAKLLQEFGTLDNLMANTAKVTGKKRESLEASAELVKTSRSLVRLDTNVDLPFDWDGWKLRSMDTARLLGLFKEWGFTGLANQVRASDGDVAEPTGALTRADAPAQGELFAPGEELFPFGANASPDNADANGSDGLPSEGLTHPDRLHGFRGDWTHWEPCYRLIDTPEAFDALVGQLRTQSRFAFDTETTSLDPLRAELVGIALCWKPNEAYYVPVRGPLGSRTIDLATFKAKLGPLLADARVAKVNQNIKYDLLALHAAGLEVRGVAGDPMLAHYLLHSGERSHSLDDMARTLLNHTMIPITDLIGKKKPKQPQLSMDQVATNAVADYAAEDADAAWRLTSLLEAELDRAENAHLKTVYRDLEVPLLVVLAEMERAGVRLDVPYLKQLSGEMQGQLVRLQNEIHTLAGHEFNVSSLPQLRKVLFDELKLPVQGRTGTTGEASTDQESLEKLAALELPGANLARKVLEHRQISKLKGTYVDALPGLVHPRTGRLHTSFHQTVAATGRLSSSDPNLQNIPVRRENGQAVRKAFVPEPGWLFLTADYSQIELRLLAHFCQDAALCHAFAAGQDIHTAVAAQIGNVPESNVTSDQRRMAKTVNFGVIYGMSATGLAQRLQIPKAEAAAFIKAYFERYPSVETYQGTLLDDCRRRGYTTTILGRRRRFDPTAIRANSTYRDRNAAEREAINMEVQGSAADLIKLAMIDIQRRLAQDGYRARLLLQVHDELVFESPPDEMPRLAVMVEEMMTRGDRVRRLGLRVPLVVDLGCGLNWLEVNSL